MAFWNRRRQSRPSVPKTLTASGERVTNRRAQDIARLESTWQRRAMAYYDSLGEIKYAASFFARLGKLELFVGEWVTEEDGERVLSPEKARETPEAVAALDRIRDPGGSGSRSGILSSYGRIKFLNGEGYLFYSLDENDVEQWEFLSKQEIRTNPLGSGAGGRARYQRIRAPQLSPEEFLEPAEDDWEDIDAKEAIAYRFWRRHPMHSQWPDSPMRGVLDLCEELLILDREARSRTLNRMSGNGILLMDDRLGGIGSQPPIPAPGEDPAEDPFWDDVTKALVAPMSDEGDSGHAVPILLRVTLPTADDAGKKLSDYVHHLKLTDKERLDWADTERLSCIQRIAGGLEMPPEILLGLSQSNHWTAWLVSDEAWAHLEPYAQEFCDDLTAGYLIPTLRAAGVPDPERFAVWYDPARLRTMPERSKDAKDLHRAGAIGDRSLRDATGFNEDDAQTEEERRVWLSVYSRDPEFALGGPASPAREEEADAAEETEEEDERATSTGPPGSPSETEREPPERPDGDDEEEVVASGRTNGHLTVLETQVVAAAQVGFVRARRIASNRVVTHAKKDPALREELQARSGEHAPHVLGPDATRQVAGDPVTLVAGCRDDLAAPLLMWGLTEEQVDLIVTAVEQHAALTLFDEHPRTFPPRVRSFIANVVRGKARVAARA